ncbi:SBBP repeat-containing protein [Hymenobacter volaticus]|uniref:SBBP repeat-containing protein n=1 Tax=Hymenobacter volaticus TaxID=2932254 RepID=UPI0035C985E1
MVYSTQLLLAVSLLLPMLTTQAPADHPAPPATGAVRPTTDHSLLQQRRPAPPALAGTPSSSSRAEAVRQVWDARYAGTGTATDMAVDAAGNVIVTGISYSTSLDDYAYLTVKYAASGQQLWAVRFEGAALTRAAKVVVDARGNVYVSGTGTGRGNGSNREDFVTFKYSASGTLLWTTRFDGGGDRRRRDYAADIAVDAAGNVYVTGTTDSGSIAPSDYGDMVTVKYSPTGQRLWTTSFPTFSNNFHQAVALALDGAGEVLVSGLDRSNVGSLTYKYAGASGRQLWQRRTGGPFPAALAVDAAGDAYVTGRGRGPMARPTTPRSNTRGERSGTLASPLRRPKPGPRSGDGAGPRRGGQRAGDGHLERGVRHAQVRGFQRPATLASALPRTRPGTSQQLNPRPGRQRVCDGASG